MNLNRTKFKTLLVFAVAIVSFLFASQPRTGIVPAAAAKPFDGADDYSTYCTRCHGNDGRSQTSKGRQTKAPDLTRSSISDTNGVRMIANGKGDMPPFKDNLDINRMRSLMAYVKGFRH
jgi:mono/diheme cytochrome c family protein